MDNLTRTMLKRLIKDLRSGRVKTFSDKTKEQDIADEIEARFCLLDSDDENVRFQRSKD